MEVYGLLTGASAKATGLGSMNARLSGIRPGGFSLLHGAIFAAGAALFPYLHAGSTIFGTVVFIFALGGIFHIHAIRSEISMVSGHRNAEGMGKGRSLVDAVGFSLVWGSLVYQTLVAFHDSDHAIMVGGILACFVFALAFAVSRTPLATYIYMTVTGAFVTAAVWRTIDSLSFVESSATLLAFLLVLPVTCLAIARHIDKLRAQGEINIANARQAALALEFIEEAGSEGFWQCDGNGRLTKAATHLLNDIGLLPEELPDTVSLAQRLRQAGAVNVQDFSLLEDAIANGVPFRTIEYSLERDGKTSWYQLTGKPMGDDAVSKGFVGFSANITHERAAQKQVYDLATSDVLTGLLNRTSFNEALNSSVRHLERFGTPFALMFMDLDKFKLVNDTYGHHIGDGLLRDVADRLRAVLRDADVIARLGGDEFAIILKDTMDPVLLAKLGTRLVQSISEPFHVDEETLYIGTSIGIAFAPIHGTQAEQLLRNADLALYRAKADGRGVFRFFEPQMDFAQRERRLLEQEMRQAMANDDLEMHFQPMIHSESGKVVCMEALTRWNHVLRGNVPPSEFIPIAEQSNLIVDLGKWTLLKACETASQWPADVAVAVNISVLHFMRSDIVADVRHALETTGVDPSRLEVEITESLLVEETDDVVRKLSDLKALGVSVAMDDFGTGYSSLSYLTKFPFDRLKIDKSFLKDLDSTPQSKAILLAIANLGENLGIRITVEGVETADQVAFLKTIQCDQFQGYFFSRPLPKSETAAFMLRTFQEALAGKTLEEPEHSNVVKIARS